MPFDVFETAYGALYDAGVQSPLAPLGAVSVTVASAGIVAGSIGSENVMTSESPGSIFPAAFPDGGRSGLQ